MRLQWAFVALATSACTPFSDLDDADDYSVSYDEEAFPGARVDGAGEVEIEAADGGAIQASYVIQQGMAVVDGDILLGDASEMMERSAAVDRASRIWDTCEIPYSIDGSLSSRARQDLDAAIAHWETNTALRFVEDNAARNRIRVVDGSGCSSYVGKRGGVQDLTLSQWCGRGAAIHEIGHALGLWHEQSRVDSEDHIVKHWDNIQSGKEHNFRTYRSRWQPGQDLGDYDHGSIMHYSSGAFATGSCSPSNTSGCTLTHLDGSFLSEHQRNRLSSGDLAGIDALYGARCGEAPTDDHGNTEADATRASESTTLDGTLDQGDEDFFHLDFPAGTEVTVESEGSIDTYAHLLVDGTEVATSDDDGQNTNFRLSYTASGRTILKVRGYSASVSGSYVLRIQATPPPDDHGNDDASATEIRFDGIGSSELDAVLDAGDTDVFRIEALVDGTISAFTEGTTDTYATLVAADGTVLDEDDDGGTGTNTAVTAEVQAGTYFLRIRGYSTSTNGPYHLVTQLD